jgi:ATP-grasp domain, R2K clade family 2
MPTLILSPRHTEDSQRLWRAAGRLGWKTERLASWRIPDDLRNVPEPVVYVEALMAPTLAEEFGIKLIEPPEDWLPRLPEEYRRRAVRRTTLGEARTNPNPRFVKPPNDKSFSAGVYRGEELPKEFPDDMPVLVAEIVQWEKEFRCFVLDRQVQTYSIYLRDGVLQKERDFESTSEEDAEMSAFAARVLGDPRVDIPRAVVLDVGVIWNRGWAVVELNSAWGAGLYGCDETKVLEALRHAKV